MKFTGVHFLLSYRCTNECDHCFLWSSPRTPASGTMTLAQINEVLRQAKELGTVEKIYFEGGEPFLYYPVLLGGLRAAASMGFRTGLVSNCYWATSEEDAVEWLRPMVELGIDDLSLSSDLFHGEGMMKGESQFAAAAARRLGIPESVITIEAPEGCAAYAERAKGDPITGGKVRFRGRAAEKLTEGVPHFPWTDFTECPDENFDDPGRIHVDAYGNAHLCQGVVIGNMWKQPLASIVESYDPASHPVIGPLRSGGPAELAKRMGVAHDEQCADACHLCFQVRRAARDQHPECLTPAEVFGDEEPGR